MEALTATTFSTVHMNNAEIKRIYQAARADTADLLPTDAEALTNGIDKLNNAFNGDGRVVLRQTEIKQLFRAAKRNPSDLLPTDEADYNNALNKLQDAYDN